MPIVNRVADLHDEITGWRRDLHAHPELQYDVHRQRPVKFRRRKAIEGHGYRAARNPQRSGNRPVRGTALVLEAQDLAYASHRHSLGWHRFPRPSW